MHVCKFSSIQFSRSHVRLFATPWTTTRKASLSITNSRVNPNSCPLSWWCYPTISSSVDPFSSCPQSFPASGSFQMSQLFADAFELWCWRRLLRVPWTVRRSNQSILKEISPGISLEGMMLKLKLQYFVHLMRRVDSLENTDAGRDWGQEEKGTTEDKMAGWHHWLDGRESWWTPGVGDGQGGLACCDSWGRKKLDTTKRLIWSDRFFNFIFDFIVDPLVLCSLCLLFSLYAVISCYVCICVHTCCMPLVRKVAWNKFYFPVAFVFNFCSFFFFFFWLDGLLLYHAWIHVGFHESTEYFWFVVVLFLNNVFHYHITCFKLVPI